MEKSPVALVTGGSRGIGRGISLALAKDGYVVLVNFNNNNDAAEETRHLIEKAGGRAEICQGDISFREHRDLLIDHCMEQFGRIDLLVNNAGIAPPERVDMLDLPESNFDFLMNVNLKASFFLTQSVAKLMIRLIEQKSIPTARIVNISSISAYAASVNRAEYCIAKAGISMATKLWAARLAEHGIGVYEIRPGIIETDMTSGVQKKYDHLIAGGLTPIKRWGQPDDVGRAVAAIARGDFPFSTGEVFNVDGGFHLRTL